MNVNQIALDAIKYTPESVLKVPEALKISVIGIIVVMAELVLLACFILLMAKIFSLAGKSAKKSEESNAVPTPVSIPAPVSPGVPLPEDNSAGKLDLIDVDEPTAAVIMAIVSDQSGIPLNRLSFKSIRKTEDN